MRVKSEVFPEWARVAAACALVSLGAAWAFWVLRSWSTRWRRSMPLYLRLALLLPTFAAFGASPLLFDRASQPFWIYLFSGVVTWWAAHKVAAAALGRGPLIHATSTGAFTTMALFPAAFFHAPVPLAPTQPALVEPTAESEPAALRKGSVSVSESEAARSWATRFQPVHEPAWKPLLRTVAKLASAAAAAAAVVTLRTRRLEAAGWSVTAAAGGAGASSGSSTPLWHVLAPAPAPFESVSTVLEHLAFMWIIYTSFSSVMDGPLALLQVMRFTERPGAGEGVTILPHFDAPWMSVSLRELWTRRWNISAGSILRQLVYEPIVDVVSKAQPLVLQPPLDAHRHDAAVKYSASGAVEESPASASASASASGSTSASGLQAEVPLAQRGTELRHRRPVGAATPSAAVLSIAPTPSAPQVPQAADDDAPVTAASSQRTGTQVGSLRGSLRTSPWLRTLASLATFAVSGLCHEMIIAYCAGIKGWAAPGVRGTMTKFFLANGVGILVESAIDAAVFGSPAAAKAALRRSLALRILRRAITVAAVLVLAELWWWPAFTRTHLEVRLLKEWSGWWAAGAAAVAVASTAAAAVVRSAGSRVGWRGAASADSALHAAT